MVRLSVVGCRLSVFFVVVFMISQVFALGISPGRTTLDFEKNLQSVVSFEVLNDGGSDINVVFSAQGSLAEYISLLVREATVLGSEKSKRFTYEINLPDNLEPGLHTSEVYAMQLPSGSTSEGNHLLATLAVVTQVYLYVPYPGKYAEAEMHIYGASVGDDVKFVIPVVSRGEFDLTSVRANVNIYNKMGVEIDSFTTDSVEILSGTKKELVYNWKADVEMGGYFAKASVVYDEGTINLEEEFAVGSNDLELKEIHVDGFSLGEIAKLEMLVESSYSQDVDGVFIETLIKDDDGDVVSTFQSGAQDVAALTSKSFVSYWDTAGVREGDYDAEVSIKYDEKESQKNLKFEVSENELVIIGLGYVIGGGGDAKGGNNFLVIFLVVMLVLINLFWFFLFRKKFSKSKIR